FRRKGDFYNPFSHVANPVDISALADRFNNEESLLSLGEFYFKIGLYDYARRIFLQIDEISMPEAARYQKLGFCCEKLGNLDVATSYYEQADLLDGSNIWNLKHLASAYRRLGQYASAISVTQRLAKLQPDDLNIAVNLGRLYILAEDYDAAINQLHKAEFINPENVKPLRPLAWALFINRQFDESQAYYDRIISSDPTADDLLNFGHLAWAQRRLGEAINYYRLSAERSSADKLIETIRADARYLSLAGINVDEMPLVIDAIIYSLKQ
ncbi:MAG: tetratricopeptide repeat protein, partial [Muribaculaceae bacterium]|nr:tetratricopeptide repeat protein [Muribaculaceae bacterium]